ncbi:MAG: hypothetical protein JO121_08260 [Deltaproteobacteria bacterium]|nr:hypothetical protein [Deltaproteobacteria bacterium]
MPKLLTTGSIALWGLALCWLLVPEAARGGQFQGKATNYGREECITLDHFSKESGAQYLEKDSDQEAKLCGIDFDSKTIGLCPKIWSTSPGTIVYDITGSKYEGHPETFENEYCRKQKQLKHKVPGVDRLAAYKQSINGQFGQHTSATFSQASALYYHFSRYFNTTVNVPVAIVRTTDAQKHLARVALRGRAIAPHGMILAGWNVVTSAEQNPSAYSPVNEFYYGDPKDRLMYGTILKAQGTRYGPEFNGNISGKGYSQQYEFLQKTPAFLALATPGSLVDAMNSGLNDSRKDPIVARALGPNVSREQMMFWMTELSEIFLLDYIFSQQDRPGNIDYRWAWYYVDRQGQLKSKRVDSKVNHAAIGSIQMSDDLKGSTKVYLIQKTHINDNDAGGRRYTNFTRKFDLLARLEHMNAVTYRQLVHLSKDFQTRGPLYNYLRNTFYLNDEYTQLIVQNTVQAATILQDACNAGKLRFDLDPEKLLMTGQVQEVKVDCLNP